MSQLADDFEMWSGSLVLGPSAGASISVVGMAFLAVLGTVLVILIARKDVLRKRVVWRPAGLRFTAMLLLIAMLGRITLHVDHHRREDRLRVDILIDVSGSMGLRDPLPTDPANDGLRDGSSAAREWTSLPTRLEQVRNLLEANEQQWLRTMEKSHRIRVWTFDDHLHPPERLSTGTMAHTDIITALQPTERSTAPGRAVRQRLDGSDSDENGEAPAAIVLLTDGIAASDGERLSTAAPMARELNVPLFPIAVGSDRQLPDVELLELLANDVVYLGEPVTLSVRLRSEGIPNGRTELVVRARGHAAPLATQQIETGDQRQERSLKVTFTPEEEGIMELTVEVLPLPGESDRTNNALTHHLQVRQDHYRVLLVDELPRWEFRRLRSILEQDDRIRLTALLQSPESVSTSEGFAEFDLVIWGDVDLSQWPGNVPDQLRRFVSEEGGGLILIAGEGHNPLAYKETELETLLPVSLAGATIKSAATTFEAEPPPSASRTELERTPAAQAWSFLEPGEDPAETQRLWESLAAELDWWVSTPRRKSGAQPLVTIRPALTGVNRREANDTEAEPLVIHQRFGRGQVLYHATDQFWKWGMAEPHANETYWLQAVRDLARIRTDNTGVLKLTAHRRIDAVGESVHLQLTGTGLSSLRPSDREITVQVRSDDGFEERIPLMATEGSHPRWEARSPLLPAGRYMATLVGAGDELQARTSFRVERHSRELRNRVLDRDDLRRAAELSGGRDFDLSEAGALPSVLPRGSEVLTTSRQIPLWNRWETLLLFVLLISFEWFLRRHSRPISTESRGL